MESANNEEWLNTSKLLAYFNYPKFFLKVYLFILAREEGREKYWFAVPLIYIFISWSLRVPWPRIEPATLAYPDDALTNWISQD